MPNLASTDLLILLLSLFCTALIGLSMRSNMNTGSAFLQAGRALPAWLCVLAFLAAGLGSDVVIAAGAAGARYGLRDGLFFSLGTIPALLFVALFMMPLYYGSGARTVPEYLGLRFGQRTRVLSAGLFIAMALMSAGISLALMGRLLETLRIFEPLFFAYGWPRDAIFSVCVLLCAAVVLVYVLFAGLAGALVNQALQFALLLAGFVPVVWIGLENIGGPGTFPGTLSIGFKAQIAAASSQGTLPGGGASAAFAAIALGLAFGLFRWMADFRVLQTAMAAKNLGAACRIPIVAAAAWLFVPLLLILPGAIAIGLPAPQSKTVVRNENGAIYHEITVVPPAIAKGRGLVPARLDPATQNPQLDAGGHPLLDYGMATPTMIAHFLPTGLLGLGLAALLAALMSGLAASITAVTAVFTWDIYESSMRKVANERRCVSVARRTTLLGTLISVGIAYLFAALSGKSAGGLGSAFLAAALLVFSLLQAPQAATYLSGMFVKRATGQGAFTGLAAGTAAAWLHYGLTLPLGGHRGLQGGWIGVVHQYPSVIAQCVGTAIAAFLVNGAVTWIASLRTNATPEAKLGGLVYSLTPHAEVKRAAKSAKIFSGAILLAAVVLTLLFA